MNKESYNKIAEQWIESRNQSKVSRLIYKFIELVKQNGIVLDVGCGSGIPIAKFLQEKGFTITGIDISEKMIKLAKQQGRNIAFSVHDINDYTSEILFDGIVAWDSLFHLRPELQTKAYDKIYSLLSPGGYFLFTNYNMDGEIVGEMYGESFYYGGIEASPLKKILKEIGFQIILFEEDYKEGDMDRGIVAILKK